jgi:Protein of unknown function (DUF2442)
VDVATAHALPGRRLELTFTDGVQAILQMDRLITRYEGVFAPLREEAFFNQVRVDRELGSVAWPNGADVCPDVLYSHATGKPIIVNGERVLN